MNVSQKDFEFMLDIQTRELVKLLMERKSFDMKQAFDTIYNSDTYAALQRPDTGLFFQSPQYVFSILETELETGKMG